MSITNHGGSRADMPLLAKENTPKVIIDFTRMDAVESTPVGPPKPARGGPGQMRTLFAYDPSFDARN